MNRNRTKHICVVFAGNSVALPTTLTSGVQIGTSVSLWVPCYLLKAGYIGDTDSLQAFSFHPAAKVVFIMHGYITFFPDTLKLTQNSSLPKVAELFFPIDIIFYLTVSFLLA